MTARWIVVLWMAAMTLQGWGQSQDRFALTARQVARTLADRGIQVADGQVSLAAKVVATEPFPVLDILSVEPLGDRQSAEQSKPRSWVKLACHLPGTCLPFYAIVSAPGGRASSDVSTPVTPGNAMLQPNVGVAMRAGAHATLVMDDSRSHIQVAVISLESGMVGHRIRVASPDHKKVYVAEVVSASLVKGSF
jgi:hypothetical protein